MTWAEPVVEFGPSFAATSANGTCLLELCMAAELFSTVGVDIGICLASCLGVDSFIDYTEESRSDNFSIVIFATIFYYI